MKSETNPVDLNIAKIESKMDEKFVERLILREGYEKDFEGIVLSKGAAKSLLRDKFYCQSRLREYCKIKNEKKHIVTGFGPTNAPTAGTLSVIFKAILFAESGIDSTIVISDLGAFNSRNVEMEKILYLSERFKKFIKNLGFKGDVRTHSDFTLLKASAVTSKNLSIDDLVNNSEITVKLYEALGLQGGDFATLFDLNLCVADILLPILNNKKESVLVLAGIEEHFLPKIAGIVLERLKKTHKKFVAGNEFVACVFAKVLNGFNDYPKMSKSIPDSSVNLDDSENEIKIKMLDCRKKDEFIIMQMISQVSSWEDKKIEEARRSYKRGGKEWYDVKREYLEYFLNLKKIWDSTEIRNKKFSLFDIKGMSS